MSRVNYLQDVPDEILEYIFIHVEPIELLKSSQFVCKSWNSVINRPSLWRQICIHRGLGDPAELTGVEDYRAYYFSLSGNLIKNSWAEDGTKKWHQTRSSGFKVEDCYPKAVGCQPLPVEAVEQARRDIGNNREQPFRCWATTHYPCKKSQIINLINCGMTSQLLDSKDRPDIRVSVWTAARCDCGSIYNLIVQLLNKDEKPLDEVKETVDVPQWQDGSWNQVIHIFSPIPVGTRYVKFIHSGQDSQYWAGHYGSKFTGASVNLVFKLKRS